MEEFIVPQVNSRFGFGLLNAAALTEAAKHWITAPKQSICEIEPVKFQPQYVFIKKKFIIIFFCVDN